MRASAGKDFGKTIGQDGAGHGDGDSQVRFARLRRHVRPAPHARLCQMHRVRDASQVRQVCQVAKWARPHSLALMRANAKIHPRHIFRVSLAALVPSHRFARCARPPPLRTRARAAAARVVHPTSYLHITRITRPIAPYFLHITRITCRKERKFVLHNFLFLTSDTSNM